MGRLLAGRYELGSLLGSGGSSHVYRARDRRLERDVAAKVLHVGHNGDRQARERFLREALLGGRISHPNAVRVLDAGDDDSGLYIIMELVAGEDLAARIARAGPLPERDAVDIVAQVLDVLAAAHRADVVHRDVKPSNILLADDGRARLVDFGIAKPLQDLTAGLTGTGEIIGTAKYLSPEQARGEPAGPATDLYATGAVLFEALSGRPPFTADSPIALVLAHRDHAPPPLASLAPGVDPAVAAVVDQALAKDPAERPASAAAMAATLRQCTSNDPDTATTVLARPARVNGTATSAPITRRTLVIAAAAAAAVAAAVALGFAAIVLANRSGGGGDGQATLRADVSALSTTTTVATTTTTVPTATTAAPASIGALTDLLSGAPDAYGKKGRDLLDKLQEVQRKRGRDQAKKAADLIEDIEDWVEDGELDSTIARQAGQLLTPIAARGGGDSGKD